MENLTLAEIVERLERLIDDCRSDICSDWIEPDEKRVSELDLSILIDAVGKLEHLRKKSKRIACNIEVLTVKTEFIKGCQIPSSSGLIDVYYNPEKSIIRLGLEGVNFYLETSSSQYSRFFVTDDSGKKIIKVFKEGDIYVATCLITEIRREDENLFRVIAKTILNTY